MIRLFRALRIAARLVHPHWLRPWRSPLLRWRMETYGVADRHGQLLKADDISAPVFWRFIRQRYRTLWRFILWAADQEGGCD